jgi:hypothetical protein
MRDNVSVLLMEIIALSIYYGFGIISTYVSLNSHTLDPLGQLDQASMSDHCGNTPL